jgi:dienelactone hydrolase
MKFQSVTMKKVPVIIILMLTVSLCITQETSENTESASPNSPPVPSETPFGLYSSPKFYQYHPQLGSSWTFVTVMWEHIEPEQDLWTFEQADKIIQEAQTNHITIIAKLRTGTFWATRDTTSEDTSSPPVNLDDYTEFVRTVVDHYKNTVMYWAIENEVNTPRFWNNTPEEYNTLLKTAYNTIKEVDPSAQVLDSGMASMTYGRCIARDMYEKGKTEEAIHFFNNYYKRRGLSVSNEQELTETLYSEEAEYTYSLMMDNFENLYYDIYQLHFYEDYTLLHEVITYIKSYLKKERQIFAVETGYAYRDDPTYDEEDHAQDTVKLMVSLLSEGIPVQIYLPFIDRDGQDHEEWRGLLSPEGERRPALFAYRLTTRLLADKKFTGKSDVSWYEFEDITVAWSEEPVDIPIENAVIINITGERKVINTSLHIGPSPIFIVKTGYESKYTIEENSRMVEFPSYDGELIEGVLVKPEGTGRFPAVVLVHGGQSSRGAAAQMAENIGSLFADNGYVALAVHYRDGPLGLEDVEDTLAAIEFVKTLEYVDPDRIGVYGGSHGGYVALMCAWRSDVKAVVEAAGFCDLGDMVNRLCRSKGEWIESYISFYGGYPDEVPDVYTEYSPCGHVPEFQAPVLIIHGELDSTVPVEHAYTLMALLDQYKKPYEVYISETGEHGFYHKKSEESQKAWELIFQFFDMYLK